MAQNLPKSVPNTASFKYDLGTGKKDADATKRIKGKGDLRAQKGNNNGK